MGSGDADDVGKGKDMENKFNNAVFGKKITARHFFRPLRTGGPLNAINEMYGLNKPELSVPIMQLVQRHKPLTEQDLTQLLHTHQSSMSCNVCQCRVVHGGLQNWSKRLYDVAKPSYPAVTAEECEAFVYDLFVRGPLRGRMMEVKAMTDLNCEFPFLQFKDASTINDVKYAVDIECYQEENLFAGIQVKPVSYLKQARAVEINQQKNKQWKYPVFYLYYNGDACFTSQSWKDTKNKISSVVNKNDYVDKNDNNDNNEGEWIVVK